MWASNIHMTHLHADLDLVLPLRAGPYALVTAPLRALRHPFVPALLRLHARVPRTARAPRCTIKQIKRQTNPLL